MYHFFIYSWKVKAELCWFPWALFQGTCSCVAEWILPIGKVPKYSLLWSLSQYCMPKALWKISFLNLRQKDFPKPITDKEILLFTLWGFDEIKPCVINCKTNQGLALQSLRFIRIYDFPWDLQYLKKLQPTKQKNPKPNNTSPPKNTQIWVKMFFFAYITSETQISVILNWWDSTDI